MSNEDAQPATALDAVTKLFGILNPLPPDERMKAIKAVMILIGQSVDTLIPGASQTPAASSPLGEIAGVSEKGAAWLKKNSIGQEQLEHVFAVEPDSIDVIAAKMPGASKKVQVLEAYLLCGLQTFLKSGELSFTNTDARKLCQKLGCYDAANHHRYIKEFGNLVGGSKEALKLTNPGLSEAARVVKALVPTANA